MLPFASFMGVNVRLLVVFSLFGSILSVFDLVVLIQNCPLGVFKE